MTADIPNRGPELQAVGWTLVSVAIISVLLRCYCRVFKVKSFGFDDWCMVFAVITFSLFVACALVGVHYGTGRHRDDLSDYQYSMARKYWWFCYIWYCLTMLASKISIGWFLLRITVRRIDTWIIYGVLATTVLTGIVFFFVTMFQCTPISHYWEEDKPGFCVPDDVIIALTYLYSACSVICDFTFALLPISIIWKLNMNMRTKIAVIPLMLMACVASAAVLVRFPYVKDFKSDDFLWATIDIAIWSCTEQGLAITAGSLATLRPLYRSVTEWFGMSRTAPSEPKHSDPKLSIKTIGQASSKKGSQWGGFSLTTFTRHGSDERLDSDTEAGDPRFNASSSKRDSLWNSQARTENESEEELNNKGSSSRTRAKGQEWDHQGIVKIQTVTVTEEHV